MEELSRSHIVSRGDELGEMANVDICGTVEPRLSGLFDYPDFFLWSQFFHEY